MKAIATAVGLTLALLGCGGDETSGGGTAPSIAGLEYTPTSGTAGELMTISGTFTFEDSDGDVDQVGVQVQAPSGQSTPESFASVQNASGQTAGSGAFALAMQTPTAGTYTFEVWLVDEAGNDSNKLSGTVEIQ